MSDGQKETKETHEEQKAEAYIGCIWVEDMRVHLIVSDPNG